MTVLITLACAPAASAQVTWKLYDLRDLAAMLPQPARVEVSRQHLAAMLMPVAPAAPPRTPQRDPIDELMRKLSDALVVSRTALFPGVYGIEAEEADHTTLLHMLDQVRALFAEQYHVEVFWYTTSPDQAPALGAAVTPTESAHRHQLVVSRRTLTELAQVSQHSYLAAVQPVVAQSAVGYASETRTEESGLRVSVLVGSRRETETATLLNLSGELRHVVMGKRSGPLVADGAEIAGMIEMPDVAIRSIRSSARVPYGKPTVLAVVDGFSAGECIIVAASVNKLSD